MNARSFYGSRNPQNSAELFSSESEEECEVISCEASNSYCPSELSSSDSFESDFVETSPENSDDDDQGSSVFNGRPLWSTVNGSYQKQFVFTDDSGIYGFSGMSAATVEPIDVYSMMVTDDVYNLIVEQTNSNAQQTLMIRPIRRSSRLKKWKNTNKAEIKKFLAIVLYMGIVKQPTIYSYWSKDPFYKNNFVPEIMSGNRFQLLLRFVHFADNQGEAVDDRLSKVRKLLEILEKNFTKCRRPGETIAID